MKLRLTAFAVPVLLAACAESSRTPMQPEAAAPLARHVASATQSYASGTTPVTAYDPIFPEEADLSWPTTSCTATPAVGLNADWQNPHPAVTGLTHPWLYDWFTGAEWINAWGTPGQTPASQGPNGQSWTKYTTQVQGNGSFVIRLLADNCSWIYLDNTLVGVQNTDLSKNSYGLTLNGTHSLTFIIFDGGGAAGGKFKLETTTTPPPPLNNDLDGDGHPNSADDFPLDPTRWDAHNLIANGSFEYPAIKAGPWPLSPTVFPWQTFAASNPDLAGWTVESNSVDTQRGEQAFQFTGVPDGLQVLDLNAAAISQAVTTTAHYKYRVSFSLSKNYTCVSGSARMRVAFGNASQEFTFSNGGSAQNMVWDAHTLDGVSSGTSETLRFTSTAWGGCGGPMLDKVSIEAMGPADITPPSIVPTITGTLGSNGWYTSNVGVTWAVTDAESAVTSAQGCDATNVTQDTGGVTITCTATSQGGSASQSVTIKRDASAPTIAPTVSGTMGLAGWYTSDVTVLWNVADGTSGVASNSGCSATTTTTDNGGTTYTCTATNGAGLSATQSVSARRDATVPAIAYAGNAGSYTVDQTVAITCSASDAMSGLAGNTCANVSGAAYTFAAGTNNFSAAAQDVAGNGNTASTSFTVVVTPGSVCALVERWVSNAGVANSMCVKLRQGSYGAFRNELSAQSGKKITEANAAILLRLVNLLG
jgi:hypothetical protein